MKYYWPEKGEIRHNGVRQRLLEDLEFLEEFNREIACQEVTLRVTEDNRIRRHLKELRDAYTQVRIDFVKKWNK